MWLRKIFPLRFIFTVVLVFILWQAWVFMRPRPRDYTEAEVGALKAVMAKAVSEWSSRLSAPTRFGVAHLVNDPHNIATTAMREALTEHTGWTVQEGSFIRKFLTDIAHAVEQATSLEEVLHAGRKVELDVVIAGRVLDVVTSNQTGRATAQLYAYDVRKGTCVFNERVVAEWRPNVIQRATRGLFHLSARAKFFSWLAFVVLLPWLTYPVTRWALARKSNPASFVVVSSYTLADLAFTLCLVGFSVAGGGPWLKFLAIFILCAAYNYWACERIAERTE